MKQKIEELRQEKDDKKKEKESKTVILRSKIAENDILSKVKQMIKWIEKGHSVRLMIGQSGEKGDAVRKYEAKTVTIVFFSYYDWYW